MNNQYRNKKDIFSDFSEYVSKGKANFYRKNLLPLVMGNREGCYFYDIDRKRILTVIQMVVFLI